MPAVKEAIDRMSSAEKVETMEYLWAAMTASAEPEPPAWHGDILAERRRRVAAGEEKFMSVAESKRRLYEKVHAR
ncbi:MAG: addiction module protein [Kiritimatiellae bacterium]|nr:addiction module protein [Kiritimatiellia bacterium]